MTSQSGLSTASSLLRGLQRRDDKAWQTLVHLYGPLVYHWCRRMELDSHAAADVLQEVFASVASAISRFDTRRSEGTFRGWLWRITRNKLLDRQRRGERLPTAEGGTEALRRWADLPDPFTDDSLDPRDRTETTSLVHRALELIRTDFEPATWTAFWRVVVDQQSTQDVADAMGMQPAAVRQAKSRVLRRLRVALGDLQD